jgi:CelD/BcsL family acetyltransferase involved in cellulose biosynthesis
MFSNFPKQENQKGECFQVNQWYCDYPENTGYSTAISSGNNPCYNNEKEARDFLEAVTFSGDITRIVTINGLKTGWTNGVVYRKEKGETNYQIAREQSAEVIEKAKVSKNLVRPLQTKSRKLSEGKLDYFT